MEATTVTPTEPTPDRWQAWAESLTEAELAEVIALYTPRLTKYIPHDPTAIPQQALFLTLDEEEALYGGAAGGGKTDALLAAGLQYVDVPGYAGILLRRTFPELRMPGSLLDRAESWLRPTDAHWDGLNTRWAFPSGATLGFGFLQTEVDKHRYQSAEFTFIGVDELTTFTESQYTYLHSRLRRPSHGPLSRVPIRMRAASNPGGIGHEWVKQRFLVEHRGVYVPARLYDNPFVDIAAYAAQLDKLDPVTRAQLLEGDWGATPKGNMFRRERAEVIELAPRMARQVRRWDLAATEDLSDTGDPDYTVGVRMGLTSDGDYIVLDVIRFRGDPEAVDRMILNTAVSDGRGVAIRIEQEPGSSGKRTIADFTRRLRGYDVRGEPSTGSKYERARPFAAQWYAGNVKIVRAAWYTDYVSELEVFPNPSAHDDQVDASTGAFEDLTFERGGRLRTYG
jgi:predicted phage terminase large subunit-like protein